MWNACITVAHGQGYNIRQDEPVALDTKQDPSSPTLTDTTAVARNTTAARDRQRRPHRWSPDVNRAPTTNTDKRYHLGTDGTANDDNAIGIE